MEAPGPLPPAAPRSTAETVAWHAGLPPVAPAFLLGPWRGEGFATGHPLDGLLEACGWHGKRFDSDRQVHPLLFRTRRGRLVTVRAIGLRVWVNLALRIPLLKTRAVGRMVQALLPLLHTQRPQAHLEQVDHGGRPTTAMVYDTAAVRDVFRRWDEDTVVGMMEMPGMARPFFFLLRRDAGPLSGSTPAPRPHA